MSAEMGHEVTKCRLAGGISVRDTEGVGDHRPGDIILNQCLPNASIEERETARENLRRLARLLVRVHERLALDNPQAFSRLLADSGLDSESSPSNA